jgi:hypothetical protein
MSNMKTVNRNSILTTFVCVLMSQVSDTQAQSCLLPPAGLVAWWRGEGEATDTVGTNHGTLINGATFASGEVGQAFSLDGIDDYIEVPNAPALNRIYAVGIDFFIALGW